MKWARNWKEEWVDKMGLIVALSGKDRFFKLNQFKWAMKHLSQNQQTELKECLRQRFTPSSIRSDSPDFNGCKRATQAVEEVIKGI